MNLTAMTTKCKYAVFLTQLIKASHKKSKARYFAWQPCNFSEFSFFFFQHWWWNVLQRCQQTKQAVTQQLSGSRFKVELVCFGFHGGRQFWTTTPCDPGWATGGDLWERTSGEKRVSRAYWLLRDTGWTSTFLKMNIKTKSYITVTRLRTHNLVHIFETYSRMNEKK